MEAVTALAPGTAQDVEMLRLRDKIIHLEELVAALSASLEVYAVQEELAGLRMEVIPLRAQVAAVRAELEKPGPVTKAELRAALG